VSHPDDSDVPAQTSTPVRRLTGQVRALTLQIVAEAAAEWGFLTDILAATFRSNRQLGSGDRRLISETVYGLVRWERRLQAIVDELIAAAQGRGPQEAISPSGRQELKLIVYELRQGLPVEAVKADARRILRKDVDLGKATDEDAGLGKSTGMDRQALRVSFPTWMLERLVNDLGEGEALALTAAMNERAPMMVRGNGVKASREELIARLKEEGVVANPTELSPMGLEFETRVNAFGLSAFRDGMFEVMDEGSQLVAEAVAPPPRGRVVDACAGAGGKTLALAALLDGQGRILALDNNGKKLEELRRRARRAGLSNVAAREVRGPEWPSEARLGGWDRVLVDAPCSGLGTLRRNPEARWRLDVKTVDSFPAQQLSLMVTYAPLVAPGGRLIYATCTIMRQENEGVVERFLAERPDFVLMPLKDIWGKDRAGRVGDGNFLKLYPHRHGTDGFFAAVLRRPG
jgi:16S rRNA (cytosine967-C5)-methyltransferase